MKTLNFDDVTRKMLEGTRPGLFYIGGVKCDLECALESSREFERWNVELTGDRGRMIVASCHALDVDPVRIERALVDLYERDVRYSIQSEREVVHDARAIVLRFATRADERRVATGEIRVERP